MESVIVYRNPVEALFWTWIASGAAIPWLVGIAVMLLAIAKLERINIRYPVNKRWSARTIFVMALCIADVAGIASYFLVEALMH